MPNVDAGLKRIHRKALVGELWDSVGRMLKVGLRLAGCRLVKKEEDFIKLTHDISTAMKSEAEKALTITEELEKLDSEEKSE